jgi:SAM-dependent methyltransferase
VEVAKFEDTSLQAASVDLVVCSSAFHWLDRERALRQVVKVLKPGGALALIWGSPRRTDEDNQVDEAIQAAYRARSPTRFANAAITPATGSSWALSPRT